MGCMTLPAGTPFLADHSEMTVAQCIETCRGQDNTYTAIHIDDCYCLNDISNLTEVGRENCAERCEGNADQLCGGTNHVSVYKPGKRYTLKPLLWYEWVWYKKGNKISNKKDQISSTTDLLWNPFLFLFQRFTLPVQTVVHSCFCKVYVPREYTT